MLQTDRLAGMQKRTAGGHDDKQHAERPHVAAHCVGGLARQKLRRAEQIEAWVLVLGWHAVAAVVEQLRYAFVRHHKTGLAQAPVHAASRVEKGNRCGKVRGSD
jgi:hypothetical protein